MPGEEELLERWCRARVQEAPRVLVFAPHPDDEVLGLGARLSRLADRVHVVYVSDGAPANPQFFRPLGFEQRWEYAERRRREALLALQLAGVAPSRVHNLGFTDQSVTPEIGEVMDRALELIRMLRPEAVFSPPYEGGHPDHDATALAVHTAVHRLNEMRLPAPVLLEYASYHSRENRLVFGDFVPHVGCCSRTLTFDDRTLTLKRMMLACHATQRAFLQSIQLDVERFRVAPRYDFRAPPQAPFFYDSVDWGVNGNGFMRHARRALAALGIEGPC